MRKKKFAGSACFALLAAVIILTGMLLPPDIVSGEPETGRDNGTQTELKNAAETPSANETDGSGTTAAPKDDQSEPAEGQADIAGSPGAETNDAAVREDPSAQKAPGEAEAPAEAEETARGGGQRSQAAAFAAEGTGTLRVRKLTAGTNKYKIRAFHFRVELDDKSINGTFGDMTFTNGVAEFTLATQAAKIAPGLPAGVGYTVTEDDYSAAGYTTTKENAAGTIQADATVTALFINTRTAVFGTLKITKKLAGNDVDPDDEFPFEIILDQEIDGTYSGVEFTGGKATVTLKGGESKTMELPHGAGYTVNETDAKGYTSSNDGNTGTIDEDEPAAVTFTNTRNKPDDPVEPDDPDQPEDPDDADDPNTPEDPDGSDGTGDPGNADEGVKTGDEPGLAGSILWLMLASFSLILMLHIRSRDQRLL